MPLNTQLQLTCVAVTAATATTAAGAVIAAAAVTCAAATACQAVDNDASLAGIHDQAERFDPRTEQVRRTAAPGTAAQV